jgi:hypothetical protein
MFPTAVMDVSAFIAPRSTDTTLHTSGENPELKIAQPLSQVKGDDEIPEPPNSPGHRARPASPYPRLAVSTSAALPRTRACAPIVGQPTGNPAEFLSLLRILPAIAFKCLKPLLFPGFPPDRAPPGKNLKHHRAQKSRSTASPNFSCRVSLPAQGRAMGNPPYPCFMRAPYRGPLRRNNRRLRLFRPPSAGASIAAGRCLPNPGEPASHKPQTVCPRLP